MQLRGISFQGATEKNFSEIYESAFVGHGAGHYQKAVLNMVRMLQFLEGNVDGPPHWVCTSHENCVFYDRDFLRFGDDEQDESRVFTLSPSYWDLRDGFEIRVPIDLGHLTSSANIYFNTLADAAQIVGEIARREVTFASIRQ